MSFRFNAGELYYTTTTSLWQLHAPRASSTTPTVAPLDENMVHSLATLSSTVNETYANRRTAEINARNQRKAASEYAEVLRAQAELNRLEDERLETMNLTRLAFSSLPTEAVDTAVESVLELLTSGQG